MDKRKPGGVEAAVVWRAGPGEGRIEIRNGILEDMQISAGRCSAADGSFQSEGAEAVRLTITVGDAHVSPGAHSTRVTVRSETHAFSFFLRDVTAEWPIWIPEYGVAVCRPDDTRHYREIAEAIRGSGAMSELQRIEAEPEESYEAACSANRDMMCPTWLGVGRDMRLFRVGYQQDFGYWGYVEPCYHSKRPADTDPARPITIGFCVGRGAACEVRITRRLEEGVLPILTSVQEDGDVSYHVSAFATLEKQPLSRDAVRGSEWRAAYAHTGGNMYTEEDLRELKEVLEEETTGREEEIVCCIRVSAVNTGQAPRYAWFKALGGHWKKSPENRRYVGETGFSEANGRVYGINHLDGRPMPQEEMAVLVPPGGTATMQMIIPHQPLPEERAAALAQMDVDAHLDACREFWRAKLQSAAQISVPEPAVNERIQAGLLHCDLVALGREPDGNILATIGWYSPIGSESSPIIQFFDAMGWHGLAERAINFFLDRQKDDGFIQNFGAYQLETGGVLWTMGEHYRFTRDREWVERVRPKMLKACEYLLEWRNRNKGEDLRGRGYGLQDGKVADPEDFFHSFMLNALSYVGIQRSAEMLADVDPENAGRLAKEAEAYRADIRTAFREAVENSPVIPTGDGTWVPAPPPWAEQPGALALYAEGGNWFTHGAFGARDSLIGSLYLVICDCLEPSEQEAAFLLRAHQELFTVRNAGLSQPYYCRHDFIHLRRGEVKAFLKTFYNQFTALQDRETYTFWEHYFHASQHKTHEEGWFLMQIRWMLWIEDGDTLKLLSAIPRGWLKQGQRIELKKVATYFGSLDLEVTSGVAEGLIEAKVSCSGERKPKDIHLRLPHPAGRKAVTVEGGRYDPETETVHITGFEGKATVRVRFDT